MKEGNESSPDNARALPGGFEPERLRKATRALEKRVLLLAELQELQERLPGEVAELKKTADPKSESDMVALHTKQLQLTLLPDRVSSEEVAVEKLREKVYAEVAEAKNAVAVLAVAEGKARAAEIADKLQQFYSNRERAEAAARGTDVCSKLLTIGQIYGDALVQAGHLFRILDRYQRTGSLLDMPAVVGVGQ
ncbi:MAG TPA: hypothetical protein P5567_07525 [Kiritimatiellia bacterium]|nr:hypothetical protein [Kiritimatiellia bacterium]HSA17953.1 hypothetical protein [Kiritimatiellia bacterium]